MTRELHALIHGVLKQQAKLQDLPDEVRVKKMTDQEVAQRARAVRSAKRESP